jgi:NAD-dependent deacetylase
MSVAQLKELVMGSDNIVFFGGAGCPLKAGSRFRSADGLYMQLRKPVTTEEILSHSFFMQHPDVFYQFYKSKMIYTDAKPNMAHKALSQWEREGRLKAVITQNIDGLHQAAGSQRVLELHGSVHRNYCMDCHRSFGLDKILQSDGIPRCDTCNGIIKPDVVLYEEPLNQDVIEAAVHFIAKADLLMIGGTSLTVYPAAGFISYYRGKKLVLINKTATPLDNRAAVAIKGSIGDILNQLL